MPRRHPVATSRYKRIGRWLS